MNFIDIEESVKDKTIPIFKTLLKDQKYILTKVQSKQISRVYIGDSVIGHVSIVDRAGEPCLRIDGDRFRDYIRTSPILKALYEDNKFIKFETRGGWYELSIYGDADVK